MSAVLPTNQLTEWLTSGRRVSHSERQLAGQTHIRFRHLRRSSPSFGATFADTVRTFVIRVSEVSREAPMTWVKVRVTDDGDKRFVACYRDPEGRQR